ncbi:unnamed protein product [Acanthocheilonema viteae]|uniref:N-acetyltransferase domain-containing protein n=1 Tax=Acanthocheilonema viteae TaxID=6277 RepID=A0A498S2C3_ACAVI|nr:unnamed protein product [Acanthocheilonema viteae]
MADTDFKGFSIHRVMEADFDDAKKFLLADFLYNEPLNRSVNLTAEDADELFNDLVNRGISSSLSYVLRTPDGKIVALRLSAILDRPEEKHQSQHSEVSICNEGATSDNNNRTTTEPKRYLPRAQIVEDILLELESKALHKDYTRLGFAKKLLCHKLDEAKQLGCQGCIAQASAFKSQLLFKKIGYEKIHEVKHVDWLDDRGQQIFHCDDGTDHIQLVFKPLQ